MTFTATDTLYLALACYTLGTLTALASLFVREKRIQHAGLALMMIGFVAHTFWIGTICVRTGHPPITNLPEAASFIAWMVFVVELVLWIRYRVYAAVFFVYPLILLLLTISAVVGESFTVLDPHLRSNIFTMHILFTTVGVAGRSGMGNSVALASAVLMSSRSPSSVVFKSVLVLSTVTRAKVVLPVVTLTSKVASADRRPNTFATSEAPVKAIPDAMPAPMPPFSLVNSVVSSIVPGPISMPRIALKCPVAWR